MQELSQIIQPYAYTKTDSSVAVQVVITNFGKDTLTTIPVSYLVDNNAAVNETYTGTLLPDSSAIYTFVTNSLQNTLTNFLHIQAYRGDVNTSNDKTCFRSIDDIGVYWIDSPISKALINDNTKVTVTHQRIMGML